MPFSLKNITNDWALFLDRDGVINVRPFRDYVKNSSEFHFLPGAAEAIAILRRHFKYLIIVTNQQGIGKGLMTEADLSSIHDEMQSELKQYNGQIDAIYYCSMLADESNNCRKPGPYMALKAREDFPDIDFSKSVMAGDTASDILFGRNMGMITIQIGSENIAVKANLVFQDLFSFAVSIDQNRTADVT